MTSEDWDLFEDWCTATGRVALPTTWDSVEAFLAEMQSAPSVVIRRLGTIRARHEGARQNLAGAPLRQPVPTTWRIPGELVDQAKPDGPRWLDLPEALHQVPVYGWPHAVAGRRDGLLLVLAARGWSRRQIANLRPHQLRTEPVPGVDDIDVPLTEHGLTCPSCALTRWLRVLSAAYDMIDGAWQTIATVVEDQPIDVRMHDCHQPVADGWQRATWILPSIDQHGRLDLQAQLPVRRVSAVMAARQCSPAVPMAPVDQPSRSEPRPTPSLAQRAATVHAIDDVLDDLDDALDVESQRWEMILRRVGDSSVITGREADH